MANSQLLENRGIFFSYGWLAKPGAQALGFNI